MSDSLTETDIRHVARLARLRLDDAQIEQYRSELAAVLEHVQTIASLDLDDVEPLSHPLELTNRFDGDHAAPSLSRDDALLNAPKVEGPFIAVPPVFDDTESG